MYQQPLRLLNASFWHRTHREITDALHVVLFQDDDGPGGARSPGSSERNRTIHSGTSFSTHGTNQQVLELYKVYKGLVERDKLRALRRNRATNGEQSETQPSEMDASKALAPVRWSTLLAWADDEVSYASNAFEQNHCKKLLDGLARMSEEIGQENPRFSLTMFMHLVWPNADADAIAQMLSWISYGELELVREPSPPPLDEHGSRQLVDLFHMLDVDKGGTISAEELSEECHNGVGGIVDSETVRAVCGDEDMTVETFLEYMCEDGFRPLEESTRAFRDGQELILEQWPTSDWQGWVLDAKGRSEDQKKHFDSVLELEAEVLWWRNRAFESAAIRKFAKHPNKPSTRCLANTSDSASPQMKSAAQRLMTNMRAKGIRLSIEQSLA